jgi:hypothetical protein
MSEASMSLNRVAFMCALVIASVLVHSGQVSADPPEDEVTVEALLKDGWQVAGYTGAVDNWSTFILFRHPDRPYLVQCRSGYDVTRQPRTQSHCYKLK